MATRPRPTLAFLKDKGKDKLKAPAPPPPLPKAEEPPEKLINLVPESKPVRGRPFGSKSRKVPGSKFLLPAPGEVINNLEKVEGALLQAAVVKALRDGATYLDIADKFELTPKKAFEVITHAMQNFLPNFQELVKEVKDVEIAKLDALERKANEELGSGKVLYDAEGNTVCVTGKAYYDTILAIQKAKRELLGLDAAKKMESKHEEIRRVYVGVDPDSI